MPPQQHVSGNKRKKPATSSASMGGMNLLDSIMGGMTKTMDRLPVRRPGAPAPPDDFPEVPSHYMMAAKPKDPDGQHRPEDKTICKNRECGGRDFDVDMRQGDKVCRNCGMVQNNRSLESYDEEKRTFADDDKKEDKRRAEKVVGKGGGGVGNANLQKAHKLAEGQAEGEGNMSEHDRRKIDLYSQKVSDLGASLQLPSQCILDGKGLCTKLIEQQIEHGKKCGKPGGSCRLAFRHRPPAVVAASLLKEAMRVHGVDRMFEELKSALRGDDVAAADARQVGRVATLVKELLKGQPFACEEESEEARAADMTPLLAGGGAGASASGGGGLGSGEEGEGPVQVHPAAAVIPRLRDGLVLPFYLQLRAIEIVEDWQREGMPALRPQTTASLALLRAYDELVVPKRRALLASGTPESSQPLPQLDAKAVADESGMAETTIENHKRHPELPWPTAILADVTRQLVTTSAITQRVADEAQRVLEGWLAQVTGPIRDFCRQTRPRLLAACALRRAVQADPASVADAASMPPPSLPGIPGVGASAPLGVGGGGGGGGMGVVPLTAEDVASAMGADPSGGVSSAALDAAIGRLPRGA